MQGSDIPLMSRNATSDNRAFYKSYCELLDESIQSVCLVVLLSRARTPLLLLYAM